MEPLKVCVCGAMESQASQLLQALADGQVFGSTQPLSLVLNDAVEKAGVVTEEAEDLQDACYSLVMGVEAEMDVARSLSQSDVLLLVLQSTDLGDLQLDVARYADALNRTARPKQKAVIVVSHHPLLAAGVLCALSAHLSPHLVTAVQIPHLVLKYSAMGRGGHLMAKAVSEQVSSWWSGLQTHDAVVEAPRLPSFPSLQAACLLPLFRRERAASKGATTSTLAEEETEQLRQALRDFDAALKHLHVSDAQLLSSVLSCQL